MDREERGEGQVVVAVEASSWSPRARSMRLRTGISGCRVCLRAAVRRRWGPIRNPTNITSVRINSNSNNKLNNARQQDRRTASTAARIAPPPVRTQQVPMIPRALTTRPLPSPPPPACAPNPTVCSPHTNPPLQALVVKINGSTA